MTAFEEKRRAIRVPVDIPATFSFSEKQFAGRILNLSVDGLLLKSAELLDAGDLIHIVFTVQQQPIETFSKVMWGGSIEGANRVFAMGIHFENLGVSQHEILETYIQSLLKG